MDMIYETKIIKKEEDILRTGKRIMRREIIGNRTALNRPVYATPLKRLGGPFR
jgi:hypothetical protein